MDRDSGILFGLRIGILLSSGGAIGCQDFLSRQSKSSSCELKLEPTVCGGFKQNLVVFENVQLSD